MYGLSQHGPHMKHDAAWHRIYLVQAEVAAWRMDGLDQGEGGVSFGWLAMTEEKAERVWFHLGNVTCAPSPNLTH